MGVNLFNTNLAFLYIFYFLKLSFKLESITLMVFIISNFFVEFNSKNFLGTESNIHIFGLENFPDVFSKLINE